MMASLLEETQPPLILCMENAAGEEVALSIEHNDDFQAFLSKAKELLGFDVDINSVTKNQPVALTDNIYQFLINSEQTVLESEMNGQGLNEILEPTEGTDDLVYILDDGTQIRASQIQFDNEDQPIDFAVEKLPFVKYIDDGLDDLEDTVHIDEVKVHNIIASPISDRSGKASSPKCSFANSLPFKLVTNNASNFEAQFNKYLESTKIYTTLNPVTNRNKSPRSLIRDNYKKCDDTFPSQRNTDDFTGYTREEVLNMFKDSPVESLPYESKNFNDKRRHARKSDPSRLVHKNWNTKPISYIDVDGVLIAESESQDCFICGKYVDNNSDKLYLFDNEDQRLHRSASPQKKLTTQLKIICQQCLDVNFKPCRMKSPNQSLTPDEYLVIRNNQQYIFQKTNNIIFKSIPNKADSKKKDDAHKQKEKVEFVKVEIGSDGEIVTKPIDNEPRSDDVVIVKDEKDGSSSDLEIVEPVVDIDNIIDNLDDADEEVQEFLGKYQCLNTDVKELKCRFCERIFMNIVEVLEHTDEHKHTLEDGEVFPCPLCDYGYANSKYLKGHIQAAHKKNEKRNNNEKDSNKKDDEGKVGTSSPIARRTRSAAKKSDDQKDGVEDKIEESTTHVSSVTEAGGSTICIKTVVKQECLSSDDEIWIVQTGDEDVGQLQSILNAVQGTSKEDDESKKTSKCLNCNQTFATAESVTTHKCRRRARKRKTNAKDDVIMVPSTEDFIKRAQGRPRPSQNPSNNDLLVVKPRKKNKAPTSDPQVVTCHNCNESFTSKVRLKFHMQFHEQSSLRTAEGEYRCSRCPDARFNGEHQLFDHIHFQHDKLTRWRCPVDTCGKTFYLRATLTKHSRTHTDTRRYVCGSCGKRFLDKQTLDEHGVTHLQIKPFQCHICLKQLTRRSRLRMHMRAHEEELTPRLVLVCAACGRAFRDTPDAEEHAVKFTECMETMEKEIKRETEEVTAQLSPTSGIVRHTVQASGKQESGLLTGGPCVGLTPRASALMRNARIDKVFRCEYCEDVFYLEDALNSHRQIHKGVKNPFTCHICKVSFATYSRCTTHKTTHGFYKRSLADVKNQTRSSDKPEAGPSSTGILGYGGFPVVKHFLCEDCGRSYLHWTYLQVHRRMKHATDNLQHKCSACALTFPNSWSLAYHKKKVHGKPAQDDNGGSKSKEDYRIPCRDCDEVLPNKTALYKHRKKEHSDLSLQINSKPACEGAKNGTCSECGRHKPGISHSSRWWWPPRGRRPLPATRVLEVEGLNPNMEQIMELLTANKIALDKITEINKICITKGTSSIVPDSMTALALMADVPQTRVPFERPPPVERAKVLSRVTSMPDALSEELEGARVCGRRPAILQRGDDSEYGEAHRRLSILQRGEDTQPDMFPVTISLPDNSRRPSILQRSGEDPAPEDIFPMTINVENPRRPTILQRGGEPAPAQDSLYPLALNVDGEELSELSVQLLLRDGVLVNGNQMVRLRLDDPALME